MARLGYKWGKMTKILMSVGARACIQRYYFYENYLACNLLVKELLIINIIHIQMGDYYYIIITN